MNVYQSIPISSSTEEIPQNNSTTYKTLLANGTDLENAIELQNAYNEAKKLVTPTYVIGTYYPPNTSLDSYGFNCYDVIPYGGSLELNVEYEFVINGISFFGTNAQGWSWAWNGAEPPYGSWDYQPISIRLLEVVNPSFTIICPPADYNFISSFQVDTEFINIVSLSNYSDIIFTGSTINLTANNVIIRGFDIRGNSFIVSTNLDKILIENCKVGPNSFNGHQLVLSGTFNNIIPQLYSFGGEDAVLSGTFSNIQATNSCFHGPNVSYSGTFSDIKVDSGSFGTEMDYVPCELSGIFERITCTAPMNFGGRTWGTFIQLDLQSSNCFPNLLDGEFRNCYVFNAFQNLSQFDGKIIQCVITNYSSSFGSTTGRIMNSINGNGTIVNV